MTVAVRTSYRDGQMVVEPISAEQLYRKSDPPTCRQCSQATDHFFTSQRDGSALCATCFEGREAKGLARETTKTRHPLDAWMEP